MLGSLLGSLVGTAGSTSSASSASTTSPRSESPATSVSQDSTAPATPAEPAEPLSKSLPERTGTTEEDAEKDADPFQRSAFFQRLKTKGRHHRNRIKEIQERALRDTPPKEPDPWECCGGSCGIECVVSPRPVSFLLPSECVR